MESFLIYIDKGGIIFTSLFALSIITIAIVTLKVIEIYFLRKLDFSKFYSLLIADKNNNINDVREGFIETLPKSKQRIVLSLVDLISSNHSKIDIETSLENYGFNIINYNSSSNQSQNFKNSREHASCLLRYFLSSRFKFRYQTNA